VIRWLYKLSDAIRDRGRRRRWPRDLATGRRAEDLAHRFLQKRGMVIVARNYRASFGGADLDLVGWENGELAFVEVKSRTSADAEPPERAVDAEKQRLLKRAARDFTSRAGVEWNQVRFDIVSVIMGERTRIEWFARAFGARQTRESS
jgi:putative endonuclease